MASTRFWFRNATTVATLSIASLIVASACGGSGDSSSSSGGAAGASTGGSAGAGTGGAGTGGAAGAGTGGSGTGGTGTGGTGTGGTGAGGGGAGGAAGAGTGGSGGGTPQTFDSCFGDIYGPGALVVPNYDMFGANYNSTCSGTNNQDIKGVQRVVFLGDSITVGSPPTPTNQYFRTILTNKLKTKFNLQSADVSSCAVWGAQIADFSSDFDPGGNDQLHKCFTGPEQKKTLVIFTMGGNDVKGIAGNKDTPQQAQPILDKMFTQLRATIDWLQSPTNFPNGSYVVFANIYEYTDLTGELSSCPLAGTAGLSGLYLPAATLITQTREQYMKIAMDTHTDMIFLGEDFCGHGYKAADTTGQCYRGPNTPNWFDITCIHPTPVGHAHVAEMFLDTINE